MGRYEVLEDMALADCALEVEGQDVSDLFEDGGGRLAERRIALSADTIDLLLFEKIQPFVARTASTG